jgi:hypothetical protein
MQESLFEVVSLTYQVEENLTALVPIALALISALVTLRKLELERRRPPQRRRTNEHERKIVGQDN